MLGRGPAVVQTSCQHYDCCKRWPGSSLTVDLQRGRDTMAVANRPHHHVCHFRAQDRPALNANALTAQQRRPLSTVLQGMCEGLVCPRSRACSADVGHERLDHARVGHEQYERLTVLSHSEWEHKTDNRSGFDGVLSFRVYSR